MLTLFRRRRYHAWYNVQTQEYLDLRLGLPVSAPVSGHQPGEVGYLEAGSIHTIPRRLMPQADDKRASTSSLLDEHFKEITKGLREEPRKNRSEKLTNCGGAFPAGTVVEIMGIEPTPESATKVGITISTLPSALNGPLTNTLAIFPAARPGCWLDPK